MEAEHFSPLRGSNFSYQKVEQTTKGSWSISGPGVAAEWTQGGESEFMSVAARADEPAETVAGRDVELPAAGRYTLWVRYADYRNKAERFGVRVKQGDKVVAHTFGTKSIVDDLDPMKLYWDWSFAWDSTPVELGKGAARVELFTTGATEARRQVDCLCLTTDEDYQPVGREKPDAPVWRVLREMRAAGMPDVEPLGPGFREEASGVPAAWKIAQGPPAFLWNVGEQWMEELKKPGGQGLEAPFGVDPPLLNDFLAAFRGKGMVPVYGEKLSGPAWHISNYPAALGAGSPFLAWLDAHPDNRFVFVLNYGDPSWPQGKGQPADRQAVRETLRRYGDRFIGCIAGESIAHASYDSGKVQDVAKVAKSRGEILAAFKDAHTASVVKKFSDYYAADVTPPEAWAPVISCLSANNEAFAHALGAWGAKRIGHENTGNSPTLARRLAFLRGAARQFGAKLVDYQSINLGDSATMFSRQNYIYPAGSRYILDNQYDAWAGAGVNWLLKDYFLFHLAGVDAFYNEQGIDLFWKPGGIAAGDEFPVQLSPKGKTAEAAIRLAQSHPRGTQYTPVAFLLDAAHGWSQERFSPGSFAMDPMLNPALLLPGRHEAAIRGWFDVAYYPAPETQNEPATGIRQTYVNGVFGDVFDVIVTAEGKADVLKTYPVVIAAGEMSMSERFRAALDDYIRGGGTFVRCSGTFQEPEEATATGEANALVWKPTGQAVPSNVYRYHVLPVEEGGRALAATPDGKSIVTLARHGKGQVITVGVPLGLGIDERPVPVLALLMRHLTQGLVPLKVTGDAEWTLNRLDDGGWAIGLLNNRGVTKPQHGVLPTDHRAAQEVTLTVPFHVRDSAEWVTETKVQWQNQGGRATAKLTLPPGAVRLVAIQPEQ
jgi:hypothetical protein